MSQQTPFVVDHIVTLDELVRLYAVHVARRHQCVKTAAGELDISRETLRKLAPPEQWRMPDSLG